MFLLVNSVFAGPKTDYLKKQTAAILETGTVAKNAEASAKAADGKASKASKDAEEALNQAKVAEEQAAMARQEIAEFRKNSKSGSGGGTTTTVVRTGSGHDVTARLANWRLVVGMFIAGGDDLATAKAKATTFVKDPKGSEDELWKSAATIREKVRETGPDLSTYATKEYVDKGDSAVTTKIPNVSEISTAVVTAMHDNEFVTRPELNTELNTKADKAEVEDLRTDVKNISEELTAKADAAEVDKVKEIISSLREETGMTFYQIGSALAELSKDDAGKVVNHPIGSAITDLLGRDKKVKRESATVEARRMAAATAAAIAAKYAEFK